MRTLESPPRQSPISLTTGLLLAATMATLGGEIRLRLPFDIFPGAAYLALLSLPAFAERSDRPDVETDAQLGVYLGPAYTSESDLNLAQPGGTDMTFRDIAWEGKPFRRPPYYGYRAIYRPSDRYGVMLDFTHIKAIAIKDRPVQQSGFKDGDHVPPQAPVSATLKRLEFTHGYNLLTLNALRRGAPRGRRLPRLRSRRGRVRTERDLAAAPPVTVVLAHPRARIGPAGIPQPARRSRAAGRRPCRSRSAALRTATASGGS